MDMSLELPRDISDEHVEKFKALFLKKYGREITFEHAKESALRLAQIVYLMHVRKVDKN